MKRYLRIEEPLKGWGSPGEMGAFPRLQSRGVLCHWPSPFRRQDLKMLWFTLVALSFFNALAQAAPTEIPAGKLGLKFEKRGSLPLLTLPDATYQADSYNSQSDVSGSSCPHCDLE